jgi:two-component system chemotaxis sensor kinase CheA
VRNEPASTQVRVQADKVDALIAASGQLLTSRGRLKQRAESIDAVRQFAEHWASQWRQQGPALRRVVQQSGVADAVMPQIDGFERNLRKLVSEIGALAEASARDADEIGRVMGSTFDDVRKLRMRPFGEAVEPLARTVRDVAASSGKESRLVVQGADVEADRAVIDGVRESVMHLVRNAVDHGVEAPDVREAAGKPRMGEVRVSAALRGDRIIVSVRDDGGGIDTQSVRDTLRARGGHVPESDTDVMRTIFESGMSTKQEITEISGRGIGLDAVSANVAELGGHVQMSTQHRHGTTFTLEYPLTLATIRALLVRVGPHTMAVPTASIVSLERVRRDAIRQAEGRDVLLTEGAPIPIISVASLVGAPDTSGQVISMIVTPTAALAVDKLMGEEEVIVRPIARAGVLPLLSGAAILGTGEVAFVLNVAEAVHGETRLASPVDESGRTRVLVVDDSVATRTLQQAALEAAGYEVLTAIDGADAWDRLRQQPVDAIVSDVEMPRMDGFVLTERVRAATEYQNLPVILVTALELPEHRARGLDAGADAYLGKSDYDQHGLLDTLARLIG